VPDKYAGRAIRCPACNRAFSVPQPKAAMTGPGTPPTVDMEGLAKFETGSTEMGEEELEQAQSALDARKSKEVEGKKARTCPTCNNVVLAEDPYAEMLCSHCWSAIPALIKGTGEGRAQRIAEARKARNVLGSGGFYSELAASITYPLSAIGSLATAAGIAVLSGLVPVVVITGGAYVMEQSAVGTEEGVKAADLSDAQKVLIGIFIFEVIFFSAVAIHAFLDVVRTTVIGNDRAPNLTWNPMQWGKSFIAYAILGAYLLVMTLLMGRLTIEGNPLDYIKHGKVLELASAGGTEFLVGMAVVSFGIPMNLMGISLGSINSGLHPGLVGQSILRTHVHYIFLVLIVSVFGAMFGTAFMGIIFDWFVPQVRLMVEGSKTGNLGQVALSLLAWGAVMGVFFFGVYVVARLHGLFARSFRKDLQFGQD
jgi:hypothetical protein